MDAVLRPQPEALNGILGYFASLGMGMVVVLVLPFALLLLSIAVLPLAAPHFWERHRNKAIVSLTLSLPIAGFLLVKEWHLLAQTVLEYGAFISLLGALYTIAGGIYLRGSLVGRPRVNTVLLLVGGVLANLIGTTGASMVLIRPLIRANAARQHKVHTKVFFIFIVCNAGGLLTPLGDPPLYLGFLRGVDFAWTLRLWPQWLVLLSALLLIFYVVDRHQFAKEASMVRAALGVLEKEERGIRIEGAHNLLFLALVLGLAVVSGYVLYPIDGKLLLGESLGAVVSKAVQVIGLTFLALASYRFTSPELRRQNGFTFGPIVEVAVLFAGIFVAMAPALLILETRGGSLGLDQPWQFFWATGLLSGFLDNAPTYLTMTSLAKGVLGLSGEGLAGLAADPTGALYLAAISSGAVFMGAITYIGNGPNFMVKAIAEEARIPMPSFFGYMKWSLLVLMPLFVGISLLFFR